MNISKSNFKFQCGDIVKINSNTIDQNFLTILSDKIFIIKNILPEFKYLVSYNYQGAVHNLIIEERFLCKI